jgi:hypothetical protein
MNPARHLNLASSCWRLAMPKRRYHLELSRHDVLLAQGLRAESFLDLKDDPNYASRAARSGCIRILLCACGKR